MKIPQDGRPLKTRVREFAKIQNGNLMFKVAAEVKRYGYDVGDEAIKSAAERIPLDSIMRREVPLVSAYDDMSEQMLEALSGESYVELITDVSQRNDFKPEMVVIRPGALIGAVLGTMASVGDSASWMHRAMYVTAILVALGSYLKATATKLTKEEGQVTLIIHMLTGNAPSKHVQVVSVLSALNVQLADYNLPLIKEPQLRSHLQNLSVLGILRLDVTVDTVCLQDRVVEL